MTSTSNCLPSSWGRWFDRKKSKIGNHDPVKHFTDGSNCPDNCNRLDCGYAGDGEPNGRRKRNDQSEYHHASSSTRFTTTQLVGISPLFEKFNAMVCQRIRVPMTAVCLIEDIQIQAHESSTNIDHFYTTLPEGPDVYMIENCREDPRLCQSRYVVGLPYIRFYAGKNTSNCAVSFDVGHFIPTLLHRMTCRRGIVCQRCQSWHSVRHRSSGAY